MAGCHIHDEITGGILRRLRTWVRLTSRQRHGIRSTPAGTMSIVRASTRSASLSCAKSISVAIRDGINEACGCCLPRAATTPRYRSAHVWHGEVHPPRGRLRPPARLASDLLDERDWPSRCSQGTDPARRPVSAQSNEILALPYTHCTLIRPWPSYCPWSLLRLVSTQRRDARSTDYHFGIKHATVPSRRNSSDHRGGQAEAFKVAHSVSLVEKTAFARRTLFMYSSLTLRATAAPDSALLLPLARGRAASSRSPHD